MKGSGEVEWKAGRQVCGVWCPSNSEVHAWQLASELAQGWSWIWQGLQQHRRCLALWWLQDTSESQQQRCRGIAASPELLHRSEDTLKWIGECQGWEEWWQAWNRSDHAPGWDWRWTGSGRWRVDDWDDPLLFLVFLFICDCTMLQVKFPL